MKYSLFEKKETYIAILIALLSVGFAWHLRWVCDDAFISFRYAKNMVSGHGLVFNTGEYVEGYTNFLWTLLMTIPIYFNWDVVIFSYVLSLLFFFIGSIGMGWSPKDQSIQWFSFLTWVSIYHVSVFATSGLETSLFLCLIIWIYRFVEAEKKSLFLICAVLICLTRPEGAVFALGGALMLGWRVVLTLGGILSCYALWKLSYYGDLLPNTFYAKGSENRWEQGFFYVRLYLQTYWPLFPIWVFGLWTTWKHKQPIYWYATGCILIVLIHVIRVGGDFMFARFMLPLTPYILVMASNALKDFYREKKTYFVTSISILTAFSLLLCRPSEELKTFENGQVGIQGITEERFWYPPDVVEQAKQEGNKLKEVFQGTDVRVVILGMQAMLMYYAELPYVLEGMNGLTDHELARRKSEVNRVGHGHRMSAVYMQERNIDLFIDFRLQQPTHPFFQIQLTSNLGGQLFTYRRSLLDIIQERGVQFVRIEEVFDIALAQEQPKLYLEQQGVPLSYLQKYYLGRGNMEQKYKDVLSK